MKSLAGQFLVSMPRLHGSTFGESVIYLWGHDEHGAQGLVVNKAHELTLLTLLHQLSLPARISADAPVANGGPVERQRGFILHTSDFGTDSSDAAGKDLSISYSREILELIAAGEGPERYLVALGYAGWGPGQLEDELLDSSWLTAPSSPEVLFEMPLKERLAHVASQLGIDFQRLGLDAGYA